MASLPEALRMEMREATVRADLDRILELEEKAAHCDARAGRKLLDMAERFMYRQILDLLVSDEVSP